MTSSDNIDVLLKQNIDVVLNLIGRDQTEGGRDRTVKGKDQTVEERDQSGGEGNGRWGKGAKLMVTGTDAGKGVRVRECNCTDYRRRD